MNIHKRISKFFLIFILLVSVSTLTVFGMNVETTTSTVDILTTKVTVDGYSFENKSLKYPFVLIDGELHMPLTWDWIQVIGYKSTFDVRSGLVLTGSTRLMGDLISQRSFGPLAIHSVAKPSVFKILRNTTPLSSAYMIDNMTYISASTLNAFGLNLEYTLKDGVILTLTPNFTSPSKFNTYDTLDPQNFVRNQGEASTCWAFAANTLLELKIATETGEVFDFSEDHMIKNTPIPSTYASGGNFLVSSAYYTNPVASYQILDYVEFNGEIHKTKEAIVTHGAVLTSLYLNEADAKVYNTKTASYFNNSTAFPKTHELVLIGWDDAYDKSNFINKPKSNGAFIAQNSFGNSWGKEGFFYISYEDVHILDQVYAITDFEKTQNINTLLNYDATGVTHYESYTGGDQKVGVGVVQFKAPTAKTLKRISVYVAENATDLSLYYEKGTFANVLGKRKFVLIDLEKGFHTIDLPFTVTLKSNESFWIAAQYHGATSFIVPIEAPYPGVTYPMTANKGEGFIGDGKTFVDITTLRSKASIAIRAHLFGQ